MHSVASQSFLGPRPEEDEDEDEDVDEDVDVDEDEDEDEDELDEDDEDDGVKRGVKTDLFLSSSGMDKVTV